MGRIRIRQRVAARPAWLIPSSIAILSALVLYWTQLAFRSARSAELPQGYLLQEWSSESMMQTLALKDMFAFGPMSLWLSHIYPPLQDAIRYFLSLPELVHGMPPHPAAVDLNLYKVYCACYGVVNAVVYLWVRDLTRSGAWAGLTTLIWALSPGFLMAMMLLDATPLAMASLSAAYYLLWRYLRTRSMPYATGFLASVLVASLSRNITQAHVLVFLGAFAFAAAVLSKQARWWLKVANIVIFGLLLVMPIKQFALYGTLETSTFSGHQRIGALWVNPHTVPEPDFPDRILVNGDAFQSKYNTTDSVRDNYRLSNGWYELVVSDPIDSAIGAARSLTVTVPELLRPTSQYTENFLVAELPWRGAYDWLFASWRYVVIVLGAAVIILRSLGSGGPARAIRRYGWLLGFYVMVAIPVLWSNRWIMGRESEGPIWTDATRLKLFIEVPLVVLVSYAAWIVTGRLRSRLRRP